MNPYSFKRFLENPGRPRHPIQLVQTGSNHIIVQGDLPDCVRNGDTGLVATDDISSPDNSLSSSFHRASRPNLLQTTPLDDPIAGPDHVTDTMGTTDMDENDHQTLFQNPTSYRLPDIHLCTTADVRSSPTIGVHRISSCMETDTHMAHIASRGLPDFLPHRFVEAEVHGTPGSSHLPPLSGMGPTLPLQSTSLPTLLMGVSNIRSRHIVSSKSQDELARSSLREAKNNVSELSRHTLPTSVSHSERMQTNQALLSDGQWSTHTTPSSSQADPFIDAHPVGLSGSILSPDPRFLNQQERIEALAVRLDETEHELREARRLLREQTQLLYSVRAESEVIRREAEVRVKALEHELAAERLRSAKDRLVAAQLRGQLASVRQHPQHTPTDLSPPSSVLHLTGSSERLYSPQATVTPSHHTHVNYRSIEIGTACTSTIANTTRKPNNSESAPPDASCR